MNEPITQEYRDSLELDWEKFHSRSRDGIGTMSIPGQETADMLYTMIQKLRQTEERASKATGDLNITVERVAKLESEVDALKKRLDMAERALSKTIINVATHTHSTQGTAVVPLAS